VNSASPATRSIGGRIAKGEVAILAQKESIDKTKEALDKQVSQELKPQRARIIAEEDAGRS
jgi:hypothetical protein